MNKKIIFLDIDGTLTEPGVNVPPESAVKAVNAARKLGHKVFLCTGRNYGMLSPLLKYGFDGFIGSAGGYIESAERVIFDCPMTESQRVKIVKTLSENGIFSTVETKTETFTDDGFKEFLAENATKSGNSELLRWRKQIEEALNIKSMKDYDGSPVYKVLFMCLEEKQVEAMQEAFGEEFLICVQDRDKYGIINGEIINKKFDKGQAVNRVCEDLGADIMDTIGFGDSMNDKEMIETVGISVCMANGSETLKSLADYICPAVKEDGLYFAFQKYGLV